MTGNVVIKILGITRRGAGHRVNEDAIGIGGAAVWAHDAVVHPPQPPGRPVAGNLTAPVAVVVADGVSGTGDARGTAVEVASRTSSLVGVATLAELQAGVNDVHLDLVQSGDAERTRRGSTLAGVVIQPGGAIWQFHVGDSRIYYNEMSSFVSSADDTANLPMSKGRKTLTRWLGMEDAVTVDPHVDVHPPAPWRRLLLCSDGVVNRLGDERIEQAAMRLSRLGNYTVPLEDVFEELFPVGEPVGDDDETAVLLDVFVQQDRR
jgi:serine/threonine protein phosphatase PrpC